jgi:uncharacterized protein YdhG (YjbR/CyaY superfamily)
MAMPKFKTVEEYLASIPAEAVEMTEELRATIMKAAPKAEEVLSYNMPAYRQNGILVYWCLFKNHIGFFPTSSPIVVFADELKGYKTSKGTIQFPLDRPIPKALVKKIVKYRMIEDAENAQAKATKKKKK